MSRLFYILFLSFTILVNSEITVNNINKNVSTILNVTVSNQIPSEGKESVKKEPESIERSLNLASKPNATFNDTNIRKFDDFKPSMIFNGFDNFYSNPQSKNFDVNSWGNNGWPENPSKQEESSLESPWKSSQVKFPASTEGRPYTFENNYDKPPTPATSPIDLVYKQPTVPAVQPQIYLPRPTVPTRPPESMWKKLLSFTGLENKLPMPVSKTLFNDNPYNNHVEYSYGDHNSYGEHHSYQGGGGLEHHSHGYSYPKEHHYSVDSHGGGGMSSFKKILKVLAAIIPIGLFLSALTPTIITVSPTNSTTGRFNRKDESDSLMNKVATSLVSLKKLHENECQHKVFCELMVNAMFSNNAEEHIKNLLDNFVKGSGPSESTFTKILEAVKNQDCSPIICNDMKDPT